MPKAQEPRFLLKPRTPTIRLWSSLSHSPSACRQLHVLPSAQRRPQAMKTTLPGARRARPAPVCKSPLPRPVASAEMSLLARLPRDARFIQRTRTERPALGSRRPGRQISIPSKGIGTSLNSRRRTPTASVAPAPFTTSWPASPQPSLTPPFHFSHPRPGDPIDRGTQRERRAERQRLRPRSGG